jgi:hypothetical protein
MAATDKAIKGKVGIPAEYFLRMAKHDYDDYREALAREFYQNSIDAGAREIRVDVDEESRTVTVADDGCGMTRDILINKLLVLGGTHKAEGAVGAFGKAKEILLFSWASYSVLTWKGSEAWAVHGAGAEYTVQPGIPGDEKPSGTIIQIVIPKGEDICAIGRAFRTVAHKIQTRTKIILGGIPILCNLYRGRLQRRTDWCRIYQTKKYTNYNASVRIDGIWMFDWWIGAGYGTVVIELDRTSLECLTSNRDGLKGQWRQTAEKFLRELAIDKTSALRDREELVTELIRGTGAVNMADEKVDQIITSYTDGDIGPQEVAGAIGRVLEEQGGVAVSENLADLAAEAKRVGSWYDLIGKIKFLANAPDFVIRYPRNKRAVLRRYTETARARTIAKMWGETVKQVLADNAKTSVSYRPGFTFERGIEAQIKGTADGSKLILLNPKNLGAVVGCDKPLSNRKLLIEELKDRAIHEVTHLEKDYHDEDFVNALSRIRLRTVKSDKAYYQISQIKVK